MQLEIPLSTVEYVCKIASDKIIILDPAPANNKLTNSILEKVYIIKPNEKELAYITKMPTSTTDEIITAGKELLKRGVQNVIVSLGEKGSILINKEKCESFYPIKTNAIDTTAAGDSFIGAVVFLLAKGNTIEESIEFGNKVASITVSRKGAQNSIPSYKEVII